MQQAEAYMPPVGQGTDDRVQGRNRGIGAIFTPITEDDLIMTYSFTYQVEPDLIITDESRGKELEISWYKERINCKIYTYSIEQYTVKNGKEVSAWYKVSVFSFDEVDVEKVKSEMTQALSLEFSRQKDHVKEEI